MTYKYDVININIKRLGRLLKYIYVGNDHTIVISDYNLLHFTVTGKCLNFSQL